MKFRVGDRVRVTSPDTEWFGVFGTVKLTDRHGRVWITLNELHPSPTKSFACSQLSLALPQSSDNSDVAYPSYCPPKHILPE